MQPEDIDKLFRDRLESHAPTPPDYLWQQLEEELQPTKKRPLRWLWAVAAAVALLLASSLLWLQLAPTPGTAPLATNPRPTRPISQAPLRTARSEKKSVATTISQTTATPPLPSTSPKAAGATPRPRPEATRPEARQQVATGHPVRASQAFRTAPTPEMPVPLPTPNELVITTPKTQPERSSSVAEAALVPQPQPATALAAPTGPIEVEVHRSNGEPAAANAKDPTRRSLGGVLLRQARHAVRGERVSLAETGLPETVTVQARVAGRTLTKVIQL
ncbi:MAG: hypothetical protein H7Z21_01035 [Hymenobacter sp.]|nr:hypothetical protein [Hymenobacter sp.]